MLHASSCIFFLAKGFSAIAKYNAALLVADGLTVSQLQVLVMLHIRVHARAVCIVQQCQPLKDAVTATTVVAATAAPQYITILRHIVHYGPQAFGRRSKSKAAEGRVANRFLRATKLQTFCFA